MGRRRKMRGEREAMEGKEEEEVVEREMRDNRQKRYKLIL